jgi:hypothetical protein
MSMNDNQNDNASQLQLRLESLIQTGIKVDKNLRQPTYYTSITYSEITAECFAIISDLLKNQ